MAPPSQPLRRLHGDAIYETGSARASFDHLRRRSTEDIVASLKPGLRASLKVTKDGLVKDGNTRIRIPPSGASMSTLPRELVD